MSQPTPGTPAPANGPGTGSATEPAPATGPAGEPTGTPAPAPEPPKDDTDWKGRSRTWEDRAKANKAAADESAAKLAAAEARTKAILKAAGIGDDEDPAEAAKRTATERDDAKKKADQLEADLKAERLERAAERAARKAGANVDALLDSRGFVKALTELGDDANDESIGKAVEAALKANPHLKASAPPPRSHTDSKGSPTEPKKRAGGLSGAVTRAMQPN